MAPVQVFSHGPEKQEKLYSLCVVAVTISVWLLGLAAPGILVVLCVLRLWQLAAIFLLSMLVCYVPLPKIAALRRVIHAGVTTYFFESSVTYEAPIPAGKTLLAIHPHGIFCLGWSLLFFAEDLLHLTFCYSSALYWSPFMHLLVQLTRGNACAPADKATFLRMMKKGRPLALIPGGFEEATITCVPTSRPRASAVATAPVADTPCGRRVSRSPAQVPPPSRIAQVRWRRPCLPQREKGVCKVRAPARLLDRPDVRFRREPAVLQRAGRVVVALPAQLEGWPARHR
eukprot:573797-Prymnesium_polylepis.4